MSACEILLGKLDRVKQTAPDRWIARCPSHQDKSPSLSIRIAESGKIVLRCFALCDTYDVLAAIGLQYRDLFPDGRRVALSGWSRTTIPAADLVLMVDEEATVIALAAAQLLESQTVTAEDWERIAAATRRLGWAAAEVRRARPWRPTHGR